MADSSKFIPETAETATFAFREYFRPIVGAVRFMQSRLMPSHARTPGPQDRATLEDAREILRTRLAKGRRHEKILLMQSVLAALASLLALAISLMHAFSVDLAVILAVLVPISTFTVWAVLRLVRNREEIVQLKTIRWVIRSVDEETAQQVVKQVVWSKPRKKRRRNKEKKPL